MKSSQNIYREKKSNGHYGLPVPKWLIIIFLKETIRKDTAGVKRTLPATLPLLDKKRPPTWKKRCLLFS